MKFGLFIIGDSDPAVTNVKDYYERMLEQVRWAETLGYDGFWFGEHHFDFAGVIPAPPVMLAAAATCTETIRLGIAVSLIPYRNPIFVAEEYAMIDVLSGGRLDFGVGRGTPPELQGFGVKEDNREVLLEGLEVIEEAWRSGNFCYHGRHHQFEGVPLNVLPLQKPTPPVYFAALSEASYRVAGERGYPILGIPFASCKDMGEVREKISLYKHTLESTGHDPEAPDVVQCIHTHVAATDAAAHANAREAMSLYFKKRLHVRPRDYDELNGEHMIMVGSPELCVDRIAELRDTGTNYVLFAMNFATLEQQKILASMERMAREVMSAFRDDS